MQEVSNTKDPESGNRKVMAIGPVGVGKTTQERTLPGKKFAYLFDPNARESLQGSDIDYLEFVPDKEELDLSVKALKSGIADRTSKRSVIEATTYRQWEKDFEERLDNDFFDGYDWLIFDSLTTFSEIIMDRVQFINKRLGKHPEQADYTAEMNTMRNVFRKATSLKCNLYVTAHTEISKDDVVGRTYAQLVVTGKNRIRIPMRFSQIYGLEVETGSGSKGVKYTAHTVQDRMHPAVRTTVRGLQPVEDITIDWEKEKLAGQGLGGFVMR